MKGTILYIAGCIAVLGGITYADNRNRPPCTVGESISISGRTAIYRYCDGALFHDDHPDFIRYKY